jgi:uncharacterized protein (TIGR04255 family)
MALKKVRSHRFKNSPLRLVVCQLRFPLLLRIAVADLVAEFHDSISTEYPDAAREKQFSFELSAEGVAPKGAAEVLFRFSDRDSAWSVVLGESQLTLECRKYTDHSELLSRFERLLKAAVDVFDIKRRSRLGLRYVNEFRQSGYATMQEWGKLLNKDFAGFSTSAFPEPVSRTFHEMQVDRPDATFVIRHGLLHGTTVPPQASTSAETGPFYLLDLDHFIVEDAPLDVPTILATLRDWEAHSFSFFSWTLTETLRAALEPNNAAG